MSEYDCPKCGTKIKADKDWAKSAVSTLIAAPAVADMATQVRCPTCHHVFSESEVGFQRSSPRSDTLVVLWVLAGVLFMWAIYQLF